jgi:hypothetical protein
VRWEGPWVFGEWKSEWRLRWIGGRGGENVIPIENAQWVAGPFPLHLLEAGRAGRFEIRFLGDDQVVFEEHMSGLEVLGPWEVRIQSFETGSERRQLATWRVQWARVEPAKIERWWTAFERVRLSAWQKTRVVAGGASESLAVLESGASEMWRMGASERWAIGSSEWLAMGGSEVARAGASEWLYGGASAILYGGASGMGWGGASERAWGGASEWLFGGSSGWSPGGSSGWSPGGSSEHFAGSLMPGASDANEKGVR